MQLLGVKLDEWALHLQHSWLKMAEEKTNLEAARAALV
jgi:hypothetical protein